MEWIDHGPSWPFWQYARIVGPILFLVGTGGTWGVDGTTFVLVGLGVLAGASARFALATFSYRGIRIGVEPQGIVVDRGPVPRRPIPWPGSGRSSTTG